MSTWNRLELQSLGSQPVIMPKNFPDHCPPCQRATWGFDQGPAGHVGTGNATGNGPQQSTQPGTSRRAWERGAPERVGVAHANHLIKSL